MIIERSAIFNEGPRRALRHRLTRRWAEGPLPLVCMCNPSTANADEEDATTHRLNAIFQARGLPGYDVVNWCPKITPQPDELWRWRARMKDQKLSVLRTIDDLNLSRISDWADRAPLIVAAWGNLVDADDPLTKRLVKVLSKYGQRTIFCLGKTKEGAPMHPLARGRNRIKDNAPFVVWREGLEDIL